MNTIWGLSTSVLLSVGALIVARVPNKKRARSSAILWAGLGLGASVSVLGGAILQHVFHVGGPLHSATARDLLIAAVCNALIGAVACALASLESHRPSTFSQMLLLVALGNAFLSVQNPLVLAGFWALSSWVAYSALRSEPALKDEARLFGFYQLPSAAAFALGAWLLTQHKPGWAALPLLFAIGAREAALPLHGWFPRFVERAPMGIVVAFIAPQLGVYAHLELLHHHLSPEVVRVVSRIGALAAAYGAVLAVGQVKVRRVAAYLTMSQTGLVAFGLENHSEVGLTGAVLTWFVMTLAASGFLLALGALEARRGELTLGVSAGHPGQAPRLAAATLLLGLALVGSPLTLGFVGQDLLIQGSVAEHPLLGLGLIVVTALNGITVMRIYFGLFTAGPHRPGERDLGPRELAALSVVLGLLLVLGLLPGPLVSFIQ